MKILAAIPLCSARVLRSHSDQVLGASASNTSDAINASADTGNSSTCGLSAKNSDCFRVDLGSCGNACCVADFHVNANSSEARSLLVAFLDSGGDDSNFAHVNSTEQIDGIYKDYQYIVHGNHTTSGRNYVDMLRFTIRNKGLTTSKVRAFSMSNIPGALSDLGQNYKSLKYVFDRVFPGMRMDIVYGCGHRRESVEPRVTELVGATELVEKPAAEEPLGRGEAKIDAGSSCAMNQPAVVTKDCHNKDYGSCGVSCCAVEVDIPKHPSVTYHALKEFLDVGGDKHSYAYIAGDMPHHEHPADDVRSANLELGGMTFVYTLQANHSATNNITDVISANVRATEDNGNSVLRLFAISRDDTQTFTDEGQHFKTIMYMMKELGIVKFHIMHGCGPHRLIQSGAHGAKSPVLVVAVLISLLAVWQW